MISWEERRLDGICSDIEKEIKFTFHGNEFWEPFRNEVYWKMGFLEISDDERT